MNVERPIVTRQDQLAEYLAQGLTVPQASARMGIYAGYGNTILQQIRKRLGPQAR